MARVDKSMPILRDMVGRLNENELMAVQLSSFKIKCNRREIWKKKAK